MANSMSVRVAGVDLSKGMVEDAIVKRGWEVALGMGVLGIVILFVIALVSLAF
jgi:hypothetical protein